MSNHFVDPAGLCLTSECSYRLPALHRSKHVGRQASTHRPLLRIILEDLGAGIQLPQHQYMQTCINTTSIDCTGVDNHSRLGNQVPLGYVFIGSPNGANLFVFFKHSQEWGGDG